MAKFTPGPIITEIRKRQGTIVYSRNQHGAIISTYVEPDNTETARRAVTRAAWSEVATLWGSTLTDEERQAWHQEAFNLRLSKSPIAPRTIDGRQLFIRTNMRLLLADQDTLILPPPNRDVTPLTSLGVQANADTSGVTLTFSPTTVPANHTLIVWGAPTQNPATTTTRHGYFWLKNIDPAQTSPHEIGTEFIAKFGDLDIGQRLFITAWLLNHATGEYSIPAKANCVIAGTGDDMLTTTITITTAQLKDLAAHPIEVIPAPTATNAHIVHKVVATMLYNTTAYNVDNALPYLYYGDEELYNYAALCDINGILDKSDDWSRDVGGNGYPIINPGPAKGQNIVLWNEGTDFTLGDSDITLTIFYTTTPLAL